MGTEDMKCDWWNWHVLLRYTRKWEGLGEEKKYNFKYLTINLILVIRLS